MDSYGEHSKLGSLLLGLQCAIGPSGDDVPQTDAWIISDAPDLSGNVIADCGPLNEGKDLEQIWRVWDGDGWKEDHNISAEIIGASELTCLTAGDTNRFTEWRQVNLQQTPGEIRCGVIERHDQVVQMLTNQARVLNRRDEGPDAQYIQHSSGSRSFLAEKDESYDGMPLPLDSPLRENRDSLASLNVPEQDKAERISLAIPHNSSKIERTASNLSRDRRALEAQMRHRGTSEHREMRQKTGGKSWSVHDVNLSGLRSITAVAEADTWAQNVRSRMSLRSHRSGEDVKKVISQHATVQDMEAAFLESVVGQRRSMVLSPVPTEPDPPSVPMRMLPSPQPLGQPRAASPSFLEPENPKAMPRGNTLTSNSQEIENLVRLSNRAETAILDQMAAGESQSALSQDRGCEISLKVPQCLLGFVLLLSVCNVVLYAVFRVFINHHVAWDGLTVIANSFFTCAAVLSCAFLRDALRSTDLELTMGKLYTFVDDVIHEWWRLSRLEQWRSCVFWILWVIVFLAGQVLREWYLEEAMDPSSALESRAFRYTLRGITALCWVVSSFLVVLEAYVQNHMLLGLDSSLDCWCAYLLDCPDFNLGVDSWNCLQALLKCISRKVAKSFLVMQITGGIACIYCLASTVMVAFLSGFALNVILVEGAFLLPVLMLFFLEMRVFWRGTAITEKCRIVPAFVNQIPAGRRINMERSYLVQFITDSSAGFFVREVKLTREMLLKNFMIIGGILSGLVAVMSRV
eukprot:s1995_g16.t1